jgi:hypothetical protein
MRVKNRLVLLAQRGTFWPDVWVYDGILSSTPEEPSIPSGDDALRIFPQPVRAGESMMITGERCISKVRLYDLMGRDLSAAVQSRPVSTSLWIITLPSEASGSYIIEIGSSSAVQTQRISVLR